MTTGVPLARTSVDVALVVTVVGMYVVKVEDVDVDTT